MTVVRVCIVAVAVALSTYPALYFTDRGSVQVGGGITFNSSGSEGEDSRENQFVFQPLINFFPVPYLLVGPVFDFSVYGRDEYGSATFSLGGRCGFAYGRNMVVIPFIHVSPQVLITTWHNDNTNTEGSDAGFGMDIHGGIIVPVQEHFSVNFGPGFWFDVYDGYWSNTVYMSISVTGLIF